MTLPKAVCVVGAPLVTAAELGAFAGVVGAIVLGLGWFFRVLGPVPAWIPYLCFALYGALILFGIVSLFIGLSRFNYDKCRAYWHGGGE